MSTGVWLLSTANSSPMLDHRTGIRQADVQLSPFRDRPAVAPWKLRRSLRPTYNLTRRKTLRPGPFSITIDELFGLHPPAWMLVRQTAETILRLARLGNVILIGRGSNIITAKLPLVFHVRLIAPLENRIKQIQKSDKLDRNGAIELIRREDRGRKRYLKRHYKEDIDDPLLYDLTINTGRVGFDQAARMIADAVMRRMPKQSDWPSSSDELAEIIANEEAYLGETVRVGR
jgi:hypothetical protein